MDTHKKFINVAVRIGNQKRYQEWKLENSPRAVRRLAKKLTKTTLGEVRCCYEAGPLGYSLKRQLEQAAPLICEVVAPSLVPTKPGDRVKTDRRDARKLADMLAAGLLTEVHPPSEEDEAVRDLCRCREDARQDLLRARHRLSKFLLRKATHYGCGKAWSRAHRQWLRTIRFDYNAEQVTFDEYLLRVEHQEERLRSVEERLQEVALSKPYARPVGWLRCFHGIDTVTAITIISEIHDFRRFSSPRELMSYLGLVPGEDSSGDKRRQGAITKAGNSHVRRVLIETAWHYRHQPKVSVKLHKRRIGQPSRIISQADRAHQRLNRKYRRLKNRGKHHNKVTVAVARELVGFIWAALRQM